MTGGERVARPLDEPYTEGSFRYVRYRITHGTRGEASQAAVYRAAGASLLVLDVVGATLQEDGAWIVELRVR